MFKCVYISRIAVLAFKPVLVSLIYGTFLRLCPLISTPSSVNSPQLSGASGEQNLCPPEMEKSVVTGVENGSVALSCY